MDNEIPELPKSRKITTYILLGLLILFGIFFIKEYSRIESYLVRHYGPPRIAENIKVTFPEGSTNIEMAQLLGIALPNFNTRIFLDISKNDQGYLFPDTYLFYKNENPESVAKRLKDNFLKKTPSSDPKIIIMASILEKEATKSDMKLISGILWKRLEKGMPLQVDADMNTYKEVGLPKLPIANPGLTSIDAALNPISSPYWYYIHDKSGTAHFAKTFDEHRINIKKYLK